jgi:protein-tyrosine phosphatase
VGPATYHVLMVCTGNICRSPMAEGLLRAMLPERLKPAMTVASAGTYAVHGNLAEPLAQRAALVYGVDLSAHRAKMLSKDLLKQADLVLVMEPQHAAIIRRAFFFSRIQVKLLAEFDPQDQKQEIEDPYGQSYEAYRQCAVRIETCVRGLIPFLEQQVQQRSKA